MDDLPCEGQYLSFYESHATADVPHPPSPQMVIVISFSNAMVCVHDVRVCDKRDRFSDNTGEALAQRYQKGTAEWYNRRM